MKLRLTQTILILASAALVTACSGAGKGSPASPTASDPASGASSLAVSGSLAAAGAHALTGMRHYGLLAGSSVSTPMIDLSAYNVVCSTTTSPPVTSSAKVSADGSFSLSIAGGLDQPLTCYLTDGTGVKVADFLISDAGNKDLNGNNSVSSTATFASSVALGSVSFDPDAGEVTVPIARVKNEISDAAPAAGKVFDPTGTWTIGAVDFNLPKGVRGPCTQAENQSHDCNGPPDGQVLYFKLWDAVKTADNSQIYALQLWAADDNNSEAAYATCGSKIGLTAQQEADLGLDFSANGAADAPFSFTSRLTGFNDQASGNKNETVNLADGWEMDVAKSQWSFQTGCGPRTATIGGVTYNAWSCGADENGMYQLGLTGGCVDGNGNPVNVTDWSQITVNSDGSGGQPRNGQNTVDANLVQSNTLSGYYNGTAVTCTSKWAVTDANGVPQGTQRQPAAFDWNGFQAAQTTYPAGTLCSAIANANSPGAQKILQLQCYSNYYYMSGLERAGGTCIPKVQMDWMQTDPAKFVHVDFRPNSLVFMDQYKPFPDGKGGSMLTRQEEYRGVQVNGNWVNCHVIDTGGVTLKQVSGTKILATYQSTSVTTDKDVPACVAEFNGTKKTFFFYLTR